MMVRMLKILKIGGGVLVTALQGNDGKAAEGRADLDRASSEASNKALLNSSSPAIIMSESSLLRFAAEIRPPMTPSNASRVSTS